MPQSPTLPIVAEWLADMDRWSPANKVNATSVLNHYAQWLAAERLDVLEVRRADIKRYLAERVAGTAGVRDARGVPLAQVTNKASERGIWRQLRAFYRWAATAVADGGGGELRTDPMEGWRGPKVSSRPRTKVAAVEDIRRLEQHFDTSILGRRNAAVVSLMFRSGLRVGELRWLDLAHLTRRRDGYAVLHVPHTKNGEPRDVPVHPETLRYLERYLRKRGPLPGPLFRGATNRTADVDGRVRTKAFQDVIRRARQRLGITVTPHQLRRTFTSQYLRHGGDTLSLEVIGGWSDPRMPRRYLGEEASEASIERYFAVVDPRPAAAG